MSYIEIVDPDRAEGRLLEVYEEVRGRRGKVADIMAVHSLMPETMLSHLRLYMDIVYGKGGLSRLQREAIAVAVSAVNDCRYCVRHHQDALAKYAKDDALVAGLGEDPLSAPMDEKLGLLVGYAVKLTREPDAIEKKDVERLKQAGWDDEQVLHAALVTSYFNFVNRMALGLGLDLEKDLSGFKY